MSIKLVKPNVKYKEQIEEVKQEVIADKDKKPEGKWYLEFKDFNKEVVALNNHHNGIDLPKGWVSATTFWAVDEHDKYLGKINLRHKLTPFLKKFGGNIGYDIRPSQRGKGYASEMLRLCLIEAKKMGMKKILITCDEDNIASKKVIEKNGGKYQDKQVEIGNDLPTLRFWINL